MNFNNNIYNQSSYFESITVQVISYTSIVRLPVFLTSMQSNILCHELQDPVTDNTRQFIERPLTIFDKFYNLFHVTYDSSHNSAPIHFYWFTTFFSSQTDSQICTYLQSVMYVIVQLYKIICNTVVIFLTFKLIE